MDARLTVGSKGRGSILCLENWTARLARERVVVAPSLLASDFANLESEVRRLEDGGAQVIHVDVMDGVFVPNISVGLPVVEALRRVTTLRLDVHLMIIDPIRYVNAFCNAGADLVSFHVEAASEPREVIERIRDCGVSPGLALNYGSLVERVVPFASLVDLLLVMSVPAGFGGQKFHDDALNSIRELRSVLSEDSLLEIDGGIDETTIGKAAVAGVNLFVAGTGVFKADNYGEQMRILKERALRAILLENERQTA